MIDIVAHRLVFDCQAWLGVLIAGQQEAPKMSLFQANSLI